MQQLRFQTSFCVFLSPAQLVSGCTNFEGARSATHLRDTLSPLSPPSRRSLSHIHALPTRASDSFLRYLQLYENFFTFDFGLLGEGVHQVVERFHLATERLGGGPLLASWRRAVDVVDDSGARNAGQQ